MQKIEGIDGVEKVHTVQSMEISWEAHGDEESRDDTARPLDKERTEKLKRAKTYRGVLL